jgi:hypothetical protein
VTAPSHIAARNQRGHEIAERKRQILAHFLSQGYSIDAACEASGIGRATYMKTRSTPITKHWAAIWDDAKARGRLFAKRPEPTTTPPDFSGFVVDFFPDRRPHLPHQLMLAKALTTLEPRQIVMFNLWPEAGKTAVVEDYICRKLAFDPSHRFRVVSEARDLAERIVGTCKRRFTDVGMFPRYIARYGPFYETNQERNGKPWGAQQIKVAKNPGSERDYNLVASSWTSAVFGSRIDTLILDDIQSQRNLNQSEEIFRRIRGTFFNRGIELRIIIIGTRIGHGDFYDRVLDAGLVADSNVISVPAAGGWGTEPQEPTVVEFWDRPGFQHNGGSCCPPGLRWCKRDHSQVTPREFMELIRFQSGEETWHASYQQNPVAPEISTFGGSLDQCLDTHRRVGVLV